MADNSGNGSSGTRSWRQRVGVKGSMPKISDEFREKTTPGPAPERDPSLGRQTTPPPARSSSPTPRPARVRTESPAGASVKRPVSAPAPMAPRRPVTPAPAAPPRAHKQAPVARDVPAARPATAATNAFSERLRAQREAAEQLAKKRAEETRDRLAGKAPAASGGPKFTFADSELEHPENPPVTGESKAIDPTEPAATAAHPGVSPPPPPPPSPPPRAAFRPRESGVAPKPYQPSEAYRRAHDLRQDAAAHEPVNPPPPPVPERRPVENRYAPDAQPPQSGYAPPPGGGYEGGYTPPQRQYRPPAENEGYGAARPAPPPRAPMDRADANDYSAAYRDYDEAFDYDDEPSGRGGVWIFVVLMLLVVVAIAAGAYWFINYGSGIGAPKSGKSGVPTINAPQAPVKVAPSPTDTTTPNSPVKRKKIYDRILGDQTLEPEKLVPTEEKPKTPPAVAPAPKVEPPVGVEPLPLPLPPPPTIPGTQGSVAPVAPKVAAAPAKAGNGTTLGQTAISPASGGTNTTATNTGGQQPPLTLPKVETSPAMQPNVAGLPAPVSTSPAPADTTTTNTTQPTPPLPRAKPTSVIERAKRLAEQRRLAALTRSVAPTPQVPTAPLTGTGPRQITPGGGGGTNFNSAVRAPTPPTNVATLPQPGIPPTPAQTGAAGGYVLQMSSFRNRDGAAAEYRRLISRHPSVLRGLSPQIQEANLGASGKAYKLRLGSVASRSQAEKLCYALIAAGEKDCLVRNR